MITTHPPITDRAARAATIRREAVAATGSTPRTDGTQLRDRPWVPYVIGALLGLVVVLGVAVWAYVVLGAGDYSHAVDIWLPIPR
jgi:hypothetical protein